MENKKTMEYCAPVVKEIELCNEGVICGSQDGENTFGLNFNNNANSSGFNSDESNNIVL